MLENFLFFFSPYEDQTITVENYVIKSSGVEEPLGVTIDFKEHILSLCKKANRKLYAPSLFSKYMTFNKRRVSMKLFIVQQFNYCLWISMIHNRDLNKKVNNIHKRALRTVCNNYISNFEDLLNKDK